MATIFLLALALRMTNAPFTQLAPFDELYHWKRINWSAAHFPGVLEFDGDRGTGGAFCPWPPLYDLLAGGAARLFGPSCIVWLPPILGALLAAIATAVIGWSLGARVAIACGMALASSPFIVTQSWIGSIDHHVLEWPLTFAILGATCLARRRDASASGIILGCAITIAMFVQTALLVAAALAFVVLFAFTRGRASAIAFGIAAIAVAINRLTRPPGYPDNAWFLGYTHVALFAGAAVASALKSRNRALALGAGASVAAIALPSIFEGVRFFGGEQWLHTISEFQPLWRAHPEDLLSYVAGLGAGAIVVWPLAVRAIRTRDVIAGTIAFFAIAFLLLTISSRRFTGVSIPLLALAGAVYGRRIVLLLVAVVPLVQFALWMQQPEPVIPPAVVPWIRAAHFLHDHGAPGRVLAPWSMGHVLDVIGGRAVIIDNFGTMPNPLAFQRANEALLSHDDRTLARYCRTHRVRYVVLDDPRRGVPSAAAAIQSPVNPRSTWWWHASPGAFRPVWRNASVTIWELRDAP